MNETPHDEVAPAPVGAASRPRTGSIEVECAREGCSNVTRRSPSTLKLAGGKAYCTPECYRLASKGKKRNYPKRAITAEMVTRPCGFCGKPVTRRASDSRPSCYCSMSCAAKMPRKGGRPARGRTVGTNHVTYQGYIREYVGPVHPMADSRGYIMQHRKVMAEVIGRPLFPNETPHHVNGNRQDNSVENLELWVSSQPKGQRAKDLLAYGRELVSLYEPIEDKL